MSDSEFEAQREMNRRVVKAQRQVLGVDKPKEKWTPVGIARVTLFLGAYVCAECKALPVEKRPKREDEKGCGHEMPAKEIRRAVALGKKELRCDAQSKGYLVTKVSAVRLLNGNVEVRGELQRKVTSH